MFFPITQVNEASITAENGLWLKSTDTNFSSVISITPFEVLTKLELILSFVISFFVQVKK